MNLEDLRIKIRRTPFQPFRLRTSSGSTYRVTEPEWISLTATEVTLGIELDEHGIPRRSVYLDLAHITEVEPIRENLTTPEEPGNGQAA